MPDPSRKLAAPLCDTWAPLRLSRSISVSLIQMAWAAEIHRQSVPSSPSRMQVCPYRGLEPFREEDATFFCGRDKAIRDLVSQIHTNSFVAVVGPSGSGKSSLVFAGLLPALRQQRETTIWDVVSFRPRASPLRALATASHLPLYGMQTMKTVLKCAQLFERDIKTQSS